MIATQPIHLTKYLARKKSYSNLNFKQLFYLSWEDAFWDLLIKKGIEKGSTILVPELYCGDVELNMIKHGYKVRHYTTNFDLTNTSRLFVKCLQIYKPSVVVIFNCMGIRNNLFNDLSWIRNIDKNVLLVEDSVHSIINPLKLKFYRKNHFIIDSLRKVIPMQGSFLYSKNEDIHFSTPSLTQSIGYVLEVMFWWLVMNLLLNLNQFLSSSFLSILAERAMDKGYSIIGKKDLSAKGFTLFAKLHQYLNFDKIYKLKIKQVEFYEKKLSKYLPVKIPYKTIDKKEMRGFPIILKKNNAEQILTYLRSKGLIISFVLDDSIWSKKRKLICLPLGPHISHENQNIICNLFVKSVNQYSES